MTNRNKCQDYIDAAAEHQQCYGIGKQIKVFKFLNKPELFTYWSSDSSVHSTSILFYKYKTTN